MNWAKVKYINHYILILNGILGYMNYQKGSSLYLTKEQEYQKLLYENNIMVYTLLPKYPL